MTTCTYDSPVGLLHLELDADGALTRVGWGERPEDGDPAAFAEARAQLDAFFAGDRTAFELPLAPAGTAFQQQVWAALREIPYGETRTYAEVAEQIGAPTAVRAVGGANNRNPIAIVQPCHRVVGADGSLTGFAGGLEAKRWLLDHERRTVGAALF